MSLHAPEEDELFIHVGSGARLRFIGHAAGTGWLVLRRIDEPDDNYWVASPAMFEAAFMPVSGLLAILGEIDAEVGRAPGLQPPEEFMNGPVGRVWDDEHLADVFDLRAAGGAS